MDGIKLYEVSHKYINYLQPYAPHLFKNKKNNQNHERKYIGIVLHINDTDYFTPLSSFKSKHEAMSNNLTDLVKIKKYAVINLNNMFPVPKGEYTYVDINKEKDKAYQALLRSEYRFIKSIQDKIKKNAMVVYKHKLKYDNTTSLGKRCNDFVLLEELSKKYTVEGDNQNGQDEI